LMLGLLIGVISFGLAMVSQVFFIAEIFKHHGALSAGLRALQQVVQFFTNTVVGPMYGIGLTLFYYDQRVRKEGYDIEWMMQAAGMTSETEEPSSLPLPVAQVAAVETPGNTHG
jgi:hypothetical protein